MSKHLVIVESPAKAKTIEKYLGKDFTVLSSIGHIRSIAKKTKTGTPPINGENGFATTYEVDADKKKTITELKKAVKAADDVWLATDEDREGESISWHLVEALKPKVPLKRMTTVEDLIGPTIFLSSEMSKYITGQNIFVDGGFSL